jgi:hypothetical protein
MVPSPLRLPRCALLRWLSPEVLSGEKAGPVMIAAPEYDDEKYGETYTRSAGNAISFPAFKRATASRDTPDFYSPVSATRQVVAATQLDKAFGDAMTDNANRK